MSDPRVRDAARAAEREASDAQSVPPPALLLELMPAGSPGEPVDVCV